MKAALYEGKGKIRIVDIPKPLPKKGEVLVKVTYAGICGSDLEAYKAGLYPGSIVMGHEISGTIEELGSDVKKWKKGARIVVDAGIPCGRCDLCKKGYKNMCSGAHAIGILQNGGFAEYVLAPEHCLVAIPDSIPDKYCTVFDQIGTGLFAIREANFLIGDNAVVIGLGTIGQFILQCLKLSGVSKLAVIEQNKNRLEVAKRFNPNLAISEISLRSIRAATERIGTDFVFECTGVPAVINKTSSLLRKGGTLVQVGVCDPIPFNFSYLPFIVNHNRIQCVMGYVRRDIEHAIELIAQKLIDPEPIVTKIIPLDDIVEEGFQEAIKPDTKELKIIVKP